jgi:hypothetical protein
MSKSATNCEVEICTLVGHAFEFADDFRPALFGGQLLNVKRQV